MFRGFFQSAKTAYNTAAASLETVHQFFYGATDGQLSKYEISFLKCAKELCIKNRGKLPAGSVVLSAFMEKYIARAGRLTTDMSKVDLAKECKQALINRGDEAIPFALEPIYQVKEIEEVGYFAALLNVFFYLFPQHDPRDLEALKNKDGKRKVIAPSKYELNKWYEQFTNEKTFNSNVAGYQLEKIAESIPDQYVEKFAECLLLKLPKEGFHPTDIDYYIQISSRFTALGIVYQRIKSRQLKKAIEMRLAAETQVSPSGLNPGIVGAAQALKRVAEYSDKSMSIALMAYVSSHMDLILSLPERIQSAYNEKQKQEYTSFLRNLFLVLMQYERSFDPTQMQTIMFHLMQPKCCDTFKYEINMLRNWMSHDQLIQFRQEMLPKKNSNNETWFICRPWLENERFLEPSGPVYYYPVKQPYTDHNLTRMLTPTQQEPRITTYKMPFAARLSVLMRDMEGEESLEKIDGKKIPLSVVTSLQTVIPLLTAELRSNERATFSNRYHESEELKHLYEQYMNLIDAIPLLNASQHFGKEQRLEFAKQIVRSQDYLDSEMQYRTVYAALSICPEVLNDAELKAKCETALFYALSANIKGQHESNVADAFKIVAENMEFHELPPLMLAIASIETSTLTMLTMAQVNKVYEKRLPLAQQQARVDKSAGIPENGQSKQPGK